nr:MULTISPECIES: MlaD family protein [unclassified Mycobacterium]
MIIATVSVAILAFGYGRVGASWFGAGQYTVTVDLPESAGLYSRANVTYQGTTVGRVQDVKLGASGVEAVLSLDTDSDIPADVIAEVHSQTAIGEQFVALVPAHTTNRSLSEGDQIPTNRTTVPPDINDQLNLTNTALQAIPKGDLKTVIDESYIALGGLGPELGRMVDGANNLAIDAKGSLAEMTNVIDNSGPILDSQADSSNDITNWAAHLARITEQVRSQNDATSSLLKNASPTAEQARALLDRVKPTIPILLSNLVSFADVGIVYNANLEQMLVLLPQAVAQLGASYVTNMNTKSDYKGTTQQVVLNLNTPPPCLTGYLPPSQRRSPALEDYPERPAGDFYCRIPQDSPIAVRGARNIPCANKPWKRAPLVWMCESDVEYEPLNDGNNWKGDPNATSSGQSVPQLAPGQGPAVEQTPPSPDGLPPASTPAGALAIADYNPVDGTYTGPDGNVYTQTDLAANAAPRTLESMLLPPVAGQ